MILLLTTVTPLNASVNKAARKLAYTVCRALFPSVGSFLQVIPMDLTEAQRSFCRAAEAKLEGMLLVRAGIFHTEDNVCIECQCAF